MCLVLAAADTAKNCGPTLLTVLLNIASPIIGAVVVVAFGIPLWRRQRTLSAGNALLGAAYGVRDAINLVREGRSYSWPQKDEYAKLESAYVEHWSWVRDALSRLSTPQAEAEVYWDNRVEEHLQSLRACARKLRLDLVRYFNHQTGSEPLDEKKLKGLECVIYRPRGDKGDGFGLRLEGAIERVRQLVRPHLHTKNRGAATESGHGRKPVGDGCPSIE